MIQGYEIDLSSPAAFALSIGSRLTIVGESETRGTRYLTLAGGRASAGLAWREL